MKTSKSKYFNGKSLGILFAILSTGVLIASTSNNSNGILSKFTRTGITSTNAEQYWVPSGTLNPYFSKLSSEHANQLDQLTLVILKREKNLSNESFIVYLTNLNKGLEVIGKKPNYVQDEGIQNIIGYLTYEVGSTVGAITQTTASVIGNNGSVAGQGNQGANSTTVIQNGAQTNLSNSSTSSGTQLTADISIPSLRYSNNGYEPVKIGKNIEVKYETNGARECKGWYARSGETRGFEVQFTSVDSNGNSQGGNSTTKSSGTFTIPVNYPTYLEFTCKNSANVEVKKTLNILSKLHDESDTFIEIDKETVPKSGETVTLSWQSSNQSSWKYCHLLKTHSINGTKSDPTVILESGINLAQRKSGVITDSIQKPGDYVYVLNCNDTQSITADSSNGSSLSSKKLTLAGSVTAPVSKTANGVAHADIKAYIDQVIAGPGSDKDKAQTIFNQMNASQVTEEDIVQAYAGTLSRADISGYLAKRNERPVVTAPVIPQIHPDTSAFDIANLYRNYIESAGGDTEPNQAAAVEYLRSRGVSDEKIQAAYTIFLGNPNGPMSVIHNVAAWFRANPSATDAQIVTWMKTNQVDAWQVSKVTGVSVDEITRRYAAADVATQVNTSPGTWEDAPVPVPAPQPAPANTTASGVAHADIKAYIDAVLGGPGSDKDKAQAIFNQMGVSRVTEDDIFQAYGGALSRADISGYLSLR